MRFIQTTLAFLCVILMFLGTTATAQSWRYDKSLSQNGAHVAIFKDYASLSYRPSANAWFLNFGIKNAPEKRKSAIKFTYSDGSGPTYSLKQDLVEFEYYPNKGFSTVSFSVGQEGIDLMQAASKVTLIFDGKNYSAPLTGSRHAINLAMAAVQHDLAVADDEQHTIDQAKSDAAQALNRCDQLAAHEWDQNRVSVGVEWADLKGQYAVDSCTQAREYYGDQGRIIYQLGRAYDKLNDPTAIRLMRLAAWELEYPAAFYHLGTLHEDGLYTEKDSYNAANLYQRGADLGHIPATYALGRTRFSDAQTDDEEDAAVRLLFKAANANYSFATEYLGLRILDGQIPGKQARDAAPYLKAASKKGRAEASYRLAKMYQNGIGIPQNGIEANYYFLQAMNQGHKQAKIDWENQ